MTELNTQYDEESPKYEDDTWAIPFSLFSQEASLFSDFPDLTTPEFVEEVFARKEKLDSGSYQWIDIVGVYESKSKRDLFNEYFSQGKPVRLFRSEIEFYLSFHNWVDATTTFDKMIFRLQEQSEALLLVAEWYKEGKIKITNTDESPSVLYFLVTPDIFNKVLANPGIGYTLNYNYLATLAQNHYNKETEALYKEYQRD
jgi:hypothetical protein